MPKTAILFLFILCSLAGRAQVLPREGQDLNYRIIGFSYPTPATGIKEYKLEIAEGIFSNEDSFEKHISASYLTNQDKAIEEVASFGKQYTWEVVYITTDGRKIKSGLHHFSTLVMPRVANSDMRLLVTTTAKKYKDAYVFTDGNRALYNMKGEPVWFLPVIDGKNPDSFGVRDLKLSPSGTITLLGDNCPYEINYSGDVLWKASSGKLANITGEGNFHHQFCRLSNGHYMVLGSQNLYWKKSKAGECDSNSLLLAGADAGTTSTPIVPVPFTTLLEYDHAGKLVWRWKSSDYFKTSDLFNHAGTDGYANLDAHANSFYFNKKNNSIYISFKDINRIISINYPTGSVNNEYGEHYFKGMAEKGNAVFSEQHAAKISAYDGSLYLFDDNIDHNRSAPSIVVLKEPMEHGGLAQKIWEFKCPTGPEKYPQSIVQLGRHGGNVMEMPGGAYFAAMCSPYWNLFIVNKEKKVLWEAIPQQYDVATQKWVATTSYRSSIIPDRKALEQLIWNGSATN